MHTSVRHNQLQDKATVVPDRLIRQGLLETYQARGQVDSQTDSYGGKNGWKSRMAVE